MRRTTARALLVLLAAGAVACGAAERLAGADSSPEAVEARAIVAALASHDVGAIKGRLAAPLLTPDIDGQLGQLAAFFPPGPPKRLRLVGFQANTVDVVGGQKTENVAVTLESNYSAANVLSQIAFQRVDDGEREVVGLHAQPLPAPLDVLNAFTLGGKGALHYAFLLVMLVVAAVTLAALVAWARAGRTLHRRWWWLLGILVGAFRISLDWTTGAIGVQALTVQLFSLGFERAGMAAPVVLMFSVPVGAVAFLIVRRQAKAAPVEAAPPAAGPPAISG